MFSEGSHDAQIVDQSGSKRYQGCELRGVEEMMIAPSKYDQPNTLRVDQVTHQPAYVRTASNKSKFLSPFKTTLSAILLHQSLPKDYLLWCIPGRDSHYRSEK
tara:strand:+ start:1163 stop:1471 length:309 start_codon:yes stop_codon:yes gene_type:complete